MNGEWQYKFHFPLTNSPPAAIIIKKKKVKNEMPLKLMLKYN